MKDGFKPGAMAGRLRGGSCATLRLEHNRPLYREYGTWDRYLRHRWGWERTHVHRLIQAADLLDVLPLDNIYQTERHLRELVKLWRSRKQGGDTSVLACWNYIMEQAQDRTLTAKEIELYVRRWKRQEVRRRYPEPEVDLPWKVVLAVSPSSFTSW